MEDIGKKTKVGIAYNTAARLAGTSGQIVSTIILARLLAPEDFGLVATAMLIIGFATRFGQFGFHMGLIQRKENITREHVNTLFVIDFSFKLTLWLIIYFLTPIFASHFSDPRLARVLPVISLYVLLECFTTTPLAVLKREMKFKITSVINTVERFTIITVSIVLASFGFGVWSLVYSNLSGIMLSAVLSMWQTKWVPNFRYSHDASRELFRFGIMIFLRNLFRYGAEKVDYYWVSTYLGAAQLGFYEKAFQLMRMPQKRITRAINKVVFSAFSRIQDDPERIQRGFRKLILAVTLVSYPLLAGLAFVAPLFIPIALGENWRPTVLPLQIMCVAGMLRSLDPFLNSLLTSTGFVNSTVTRRGFEFILVAVATFFGVKYGIVGVSVAVVGSAFVIMFLMLSIITRVTTVRWRDYFGPQLPALAASLAMLATMAAVQFSLQSHINPQGPGMLFALMITGGVSYIGWHVIFRFRAVAELYHELEGDVRSVGQKLIKKFTRRKANRQTAPAEAEQKTEHVESSVNP